MLGLVLPSTDQLVNEVETGGSLGCSDHTMAEFVIWRDIGLANSKVRTLNFRRAKFQLFEEFVGHCP